jgi:hypothetical protein
VGPRKSIEEGGQWCTIGVFWGNLNVMEADLVRRLCSRSGWVVQGRNCIGCVQVSAGMGCVQGCAGVVL